MLQTVKKLFTSKLVQNELYLKKTFQQMSTHKMIKLSDEKHNVISIYTVDNVKNVNVILHFKNNSK